MENRAEKKLGRNDPCWCGSGKKYKKCHMTQDMSIKRPQSSSNLQVASKHWISKGQVSPPRAVPAHIKRPDYAENGGGETESLMQNKLSSQEIEQMRHTCCAARRVLDKAIKSVRPGDCRRRISKPAKLQWFPKKCVHFRQRGYLSWYPR